MLDGLDITADEIAGLGELAATDLAMAKSFAARAQAEQDPEVANGLARSYQRMARSYRQTLVLKMRLKRELTREAAETPPPPPVRDPVRARRRMDDLRGPLRRIIWAEHEPSEDEPWDENRCGYYFSLLEQRMQTRALEDPGFGLTDLHDHILAMATDLALSPGIAVDWPNLPDPPDIDWADDDDDDDDPDDDDTS